MQTCTNLLESNKNFHNGQNPQLDLHFNSMSTFHTTIEKESLIFDLISGLNAPDTYPHFSGFEDSPCLEECLLKPIFALKLAQSE